MLLFALVVILLIVKFIITIWTYSKISCGKCKFSGHLVGKVVIVTGANSGIGFETAKDLAQRGARVILACRSIERGECARQIIIDSAINTDVCVLQLDLESFTSIRKFVKNIYETEKRLDILINNAGYYDTEKLNTKDGLLRGMQVNYFGPFLLTSLLLPLLQKSAPSRIVNVSSFLYALGRIDFENLNMERNFSKHKIYRNAKLCTMLMTVELGRILDGTGVTANCLHPGAVNTALITKLNKIFILRAVLLVLQLFFKNPWEGAQTSIYLAVSPEVEKTSGKYFKDCQLAEPTAKAQNSDVARKLWDISEKIVKLKEPIEKER